MICVDNNILVLLYGELSTKPPVDPTTGLVVERFQDRLHLLQETWKTRGEKILIPDPVCCVSF